MIDALQIEQILSQYRKYDWILRRVLLTEDLQNEIAEQTKELFGEEIEIVASEIDAVWLSRISITGSETWEIRHLSVVPFALVEVFDEEEDEAVREERLHELEAELKEKVLAKKASEKSH